MLEALGRTFAFQRCSICGKQKVNVPGSACQCVDPEWVDAVEHSPRQNFHPTVKPTDLMRYLCRLVTPPGGVVLDPFMGSGSTGKAAELEGFDFIGIDREAEYVQIATLRIEAARRRYQPCLIFD
jgi:DNA modification methylase